MTADEAETALEFETVHLRVPCDLTCRDHEDVVAHEIKLRGPGLVAYHRLVVNGEHGGWFGNAAIAGQGSYCATTVYHRHVLPRVFRTSDMMEHAVVGIE